jgi:hypothetical protein
MIKKYKKLIWGIVTSFILPIMAFAAEVAGGTPGANNPNSLTNPLKVNTLRELIGSVLDVIVQLGAYVAVIFIVWSGFLFVRAQGNEKELETAKKSFFYTIIGVAILLGAHALADALSATITDLTF